MGKTKPTYEDAQHALAKLSYVAPQLTKAAFATPLLAWYDVHARHLPWRKKWPELAPAYDVFLSELMLQQTVVATVIPYFERFQALWPNIADLAASSEDDLLKEWAGLGYYARARNLRKAAIEIVETYDGSFPQEEAELLALPGIGPYTAAAIQAFAFDKPAIVLDGNIERVMARYLGLVTPLPALKAELREAYPKIAPEKQHSDFAQAMMDLGARICISGQPRCNACPLAKSCVMAGKPEAQFLPVKPKKAPKPKRHGVVFVATYKGQAVMERRPEKGLLGAMMGFPTAGWATAKEATKGRSLGLADAPFAADWRLRNQGVSHVFTHFELSLSVYHAQLTAPHCEAPFALLDPAQAGLASVFEKVWRIVND